MDSRGAAFLQVMIAIAVIGVLAFLIGLLVRPERRAATGAAVDTAAPPTWSVYAPALLLLGVVAALIAWQFADLTLGGLAASDWRSNTSSVVFLVVMLIAAGLGLIGFLVYLVMQSSRRAAVAGPAAVQRADAAPPAAAQEMPSAARLLGLVLLAVGFLLLNWIYLPEPQQYTVMQFALYPASIAVALVMLFDKAARAWNVKGVAESIREWLLCDLLVFLLLLGFVNLLGVGEPASYQAMFWDLIAIVLFFVAFWLIDRRTGRYRFMIGYAVLVILPIVLLLWRSAQGVEVPADLSWWSTIWPFFFVALLFFGLELIFQLAPGNEGRHLGPAIKDGVFVAVYAILLIVSVPGGG